MFRKMNVLHFSKLGNEIFEILSTVYSAQIIQMTSGVARVSWPRADLKFAAP